MLLIRRGRKSGRESEECTNVFVALDFFLCSPHFHILSIKGGVTERKREKPHFWALYFTLIDAHFAVRGTKEREESAAAVDAVTSHDDAKSGI